MQDRILKSLSLLVLLLSAGAASAAADVGYLATDTTWLKLGKYEQAGFSKDAYESVVLSDEFFLAADGKTSPKSEFEETIAAMSRPLDGDPNEHAQCRFPARYMWLQSKALLPGVADITCPEYEEWIFGEATDSISIVFATGYLGNPASYYGHTLLKFNSSKRRVTSDLLDVTVNYGAIIPPDAGPISYIYNGATGGYNAGFSHIEYYYHDYNYGELELRDLWEYELNLSQDEVSFIMAHAWEVLGREFVYYFFRRNCAYRMAEVVEIIDGVKIIPPSRPWTVPQSLVSAADNVSRDGKALVSGVRWHPSRQSVFYDSYAKLGKHEQDALSGLVANPDTAQSLEALPVDGQQRVVDAAIDYYGYLMPKDEPPDSELSQRYKKMLTLRFRLPGGDRAAPVEPQVGPEKDRAPGYFSFGYVHNSGLSDGASLRIRPAYYDVLDSSVSHVPNSELSMGEVIVDVLDGDVRLRQASLFRVEAVNGAISGLPGDAGRSWRLGLGVYEQFPGCEDCLVTRFEGDIGRSMPFIGNSTIGAYVGGAAQDNRNDYGNLFARASGYVNANVGDRLSFTVRYEYRYHFDSVFEAEDVMSFDARYELARDWDLRLGWRDNRAETASLSVGYYW